MEGGTPIKCVISVNIGGYDNVIENHYPNPGWKYYLITDNKDFKSNFWKVLYVVPWQNIKKQTRFYKWNSHLVAPGAEYSLYIDANIRVICDLDSLVDKCLDGFDIAKHKHRLRDCLYDEAAVCKQFNLDKIGTINRQIRKYKKSGYPAHYGLHEGTVILKRNTDSIRKLSELVWREITNGSHRDQLCFDWCAWKSGVRVGTLPGMIKLYPEAKRIMEKCLGHSIDYSNSNFEMEAHV